MSANASTVRVASGSLRGDGSARFLDGFTSGSRISTGVYELVLDLTIGPGEACPIATPWTNVGITLVPIMLNVTIDAAGSKVTVVTLDQSGAPIDAAFCLVLYRTVAT